MPESNYLGPQSIDSHLITGILENDFQVLDQIYAAYLPAVIAMVKRQKGTEEDARDVFQEAIVVVFRKASEPGFEITNSLGGYLYRISQFIWLRTLKKKYRTEVTLSGHDVQWDGDNIEHLLLEQEKRQLFRQKLAQMGEDCRKVLQLFFSGTALKDIAEQMGYTDDYIKKKNMQCKEKLATMVKNDPRYQELSTATDKDFPNNHSM